jgi:diguanylate cyclase (GGDEF)-like protein
VIGGIITDSTDRYAPNFLRFVPNDEKHNAMHHAYTYLVHEHDLRLVALAALVCCLASLTAISLLRHAQNALGSAQGVWLWITALTTGSGIWATHFIAMLAYAPTLSSGYSLILTGASLFIAIVLTRVGLAVSIATDRYAPWLGGTVIGCGIAVMHYVGVAAYKVPGHIDWTLWPILISIILGLGLSAAALRVGLSNSSTRSTIQGALLLTAAICGLHFTSMLAATIVSDPQEHLPPLAISPQKLATFVSIGAFTILLLAIGGLTLSIRDRQAKREFERMRGLTNAAFEGLMVCKDDVIVTANLSLATLFGIEEHALIGKRAFEILSNDITRRLKDEPNLPFESEVRIVGGKKAIPVEVISRQIELPDGQYTAIAVRDLRARKSAEQDIHFLAHHDLLTGLANRATFNAELDRLVTLHRSGGKFSKQHLAVLCLDLDRFKEINDIFGHATGDELLQTFARCAKATLREGQMLARLGGDEFAILAPGLSDPEHAGRIAKNVLTALATELNDNSLVKGLASTSIGISIFPTDGEDRAALMNHADAALYCAKAEGRATYRFYKPTMGDEVRNRRLIEHELRYAISNNEFSLVFQPQVRTTDQKLTGFEALLRWDSTTRGLVSPALFIPIAEECGVILQIGEWVLRQACSEATTWPGDLTVAVNVSAIQLHNPGFAQLVRDVLLETGLPAQQLELEITETALIRDLERALSSLRKLKELGVHIAMDDFGTGYSSLSNLRSFPFDKIKIDASLVHSVDKSEQAAAIVRAVLGLGRGLNLPVLAEGVETVDEFDFLNKEACDEIQGYYIGKPLPINQQSHMMDELSHMMTTETSEAEISALKQASS